MIPDGPSLHGQRPEVPPKGNVYRARFPMKAPTRKASAASDFWKGDALVERRLAAHSPNGLDRPLC